VNAAHQIAVMMKEALVQAAVLQPKAFGPPKISAMHRMNGTVEPM
jgi:hypothetical protein